MSLPPVPDTSDTEPPRPGEDQFNLADELFIQALRTALVPVRPRVSNRWVFGHVLRSGTSARRADVSS